MSQQERWRITKLCYVNKTDRVRKGIPPKDDQMRGRDDTHRYSSLSYRDDDVVDVVRCVSSWDGKKKSLLFFPPPQSITHRDDEERDGYMN